jgi:hypothetical protein
MIRFLSACVSFFVLPLAACAAIAVDVNTSTDRTSSGTAVTSPVFSTAAGNELLLAFVAADYLSGTNTTVRSLAGGGLTWVLAARTNGQRGTSEIWRAFATTALSNVTVTATLSQTVVSSLTVMSFTGVNASGANGSGAIGSTGSGSALSGAPTASLVTVGNNSWVLGVGNDYDNAIPRAPAPGQSIVHQALPSVGDTYWVQMVVGGVPAAGTTVNVNDTAPVADRYNLSIVEVLAAPSGVPSWTISGTIGGGAGSTVSLTGASAATTTADASGAYRFAGLANGSYTVTPTKSGFSFSPPNQAITVNGANVTGVNFTAQGVTWSISGTIGGVGGAGAKVTLSGAASTFVTADTSGTYTISGLANGSYTVTPAQTGYTFTPASAPVTVNGANRTGVNFTAQATAPTWSISGSITPGSLGAGTLVTATGPVTASTGADANGNYSIAQLPNGTYTVTPGKAGYGFTPPSQSVTLNAANVSGVNFAGSSQTSAITLDVNVSKDNGSSSATIVSPAVSTASANELLLAFIATDFLGGTNTTVNGVSGGGLTWSLVVRANGQSGTSEIWRAFAVAPLNGVAVTATLSQSVGSSLTVMSFAGVNTSGTNGSGAIGATGSQSGSSGAPSASLVTVNAGSWVVGVGNDFDNAVARSPAAGQSLVHQFLSPAGDTYWVQMLNSPVVAPGTGITVSDTAPTADRFNLAIVEIQSASGSAADTTPPAVSMTSPAPAATVAGLTTVSANASDNKSVLGVQFLLDGAALGSEVTSPPYSIVWNSTTATAGSHTLAARARDGAGLTATSNPQTIVVDNSGNPALVGSWSSVVNLPAVAVNLILLPNDRVMFYQDGTTATVWNYVQNTFTSVPISVNLFCSGHALLSDGRILVVGGFGGTAGNMGISNAEICDPTAKTWTPVPNMAYKRWYPTAVTLPDGRILVMAGWQTSAHTNAGISEIYDPVTNAWTQITNANNPFETYPFIYVLPDGRVIHIGGSEYATDTDILDLTTNTWSLIDSNIVDGGSATMYTPGKFMKAGSAADSQFTGPSSNTTFVLDMTQPSATWRQTPSMAYARSFLNLTMLPDGSVLATGGEADKDGGKIANAVYAAELWSPQSQTWSTMESMSTPREYHGTALLLPDGRVLVSGMGADFGNVPDQKNAEFFSPPYLFKGPRPGISQAPAQLQYGANFFVGTPDAQSIGSVVLMRTGAVTHFFDQNARFVPLSFTPTTGGLTVTAPANGNLAPPGFYMLFILNSAGVPSVASFVQIR